MDTEGPPQINHQCHLGRASYRHQRKEQVARPEAQEQPEAKTPRNAGKMAGLLKTIAWSSWRPILALASGPVHLCEGGTRTEDSVGSFESGRRIA